MMVELEFELPTQLGVVKSQESEGAPRSLISLAGLSVPVLALFVIVIRAVT